MGDWPLVDAMIHDGLWDAFNDYHMGQTAENVANKYRISRAEQDAFAAGSQQRIQGVTTACPGSAQRGVQRWSKQAKMCSAAST